MKAKKISKKVAVNIVAGVISGLALILFAVPAIKRKSKRSDGTDIQ